MSRTEATRDPMPSPTTPSTHGFVVDWQLEVSALQEPAADATPDADPPRTGRFPRPAR